VITEDVARRIRARGIGRRANNQLASDEADVFAGATIWYAPDSPPMPVPSSWFETFAGRGATALEVVRRIEARVRRGVEEAARKGITPTRRGDPTGRARSTPCCVNRFAPVRLRLATLVERGRGRRHRE